jgi:prefoldin subunit 5
VPLGSGSSAATSLNAATWRLDHTCSTSSSSVAAAAAAAAALLQDYLS